MAKFSVNAHRLDPYKNFKFRLKWNGRYVAGISQCSALKRASEVVKHREGGDSSNGRRSPVRTEYEAITLERGVTHDKEFEQWASQVAQIGTRLGSVFPPKNFRQAIILEAYNEAGELLLAHRIHRCWVSEYQALPDLDANANAVVLAHLRIENEGWERVAEMAEPTEPSPTDSS